MIYEGVKLEKLLEKCMDIYFNMVEKGCPRDLTRDVLRFIIDLGNELEKQEKPYRKTIIGYVCKGEDYSTRDEHGRFTGSAPHGSGGASGGSSSSSDGGQASSNYAKPIEMLDFSDMSDSENITAEKIIEDLSRTKIGRDTLNTLNNLPVPIKFTYGEYTTGVRGEEKGGRIIIYLNNCKNTLWASRSVIHECTHYKYGIGQSQWAECVCIAQELKHSRNRNNLTYSELRTIVTAVKDVYPEFNWRKGGIINGRRKSR